ncbi:MAG TPA: hypothetical protein DEQ34_04625 [Balneolaceae bacterium]|nr:hypothetical protein [Balneolaceae bacterium]
MSSVPVRNPSPRKRYLTKNMRSELVQIIGSVCTDPILIIRHLILLRLILDIKKKRSSFKSIHL